MREALSLKYAVKAKELKNPLYNFFRRSFRCYRLFSLKSLDFKFVFFFNLLLIA